MAIQNSGSVQLSPEAQTEPTSSSSTGFNPFVAVGENPLKTYGIVMLLVFAFAMATGNVDYANFFSVSSAEAQSLSK